MGTSKQINISMRGHFIPCSIDPGEHTDIRVITEHIADQTIHVTPAMRAWVLSTMNTGLSESIDLTKVPNFTATLNNYVLKTYLESNYYTATEVDQKVVGAFKFQGSCTREELDSKPLVQGHVWQVGELEYACNGTTWVKLGFNMDLSNYWTSTVTAENIATAKSEAIAEAAAAGQLTFADKNDTNNHINNTDLHVTTADKDVWNAKASTESVEVAAAAAKNEAINESKTYADTKTANKLDDVTVSGNLLTRTKNGNVVNLEAYKTVGTTDIKFKDLDASYTRPEGAGDDDTIGEFGFESTTEFFKAISAAHYPENSIIFGSIFSGDLPYGVSNAEIVIFCLQGLFTCYYAYLFSQSFTKIAYTNGCDGAEFSWKCLADRDYTVATSGATYAKDNSWTVLNSSAQHTVWLPSLNERGYVKLSVTSNNASNSSCVKIFDGVGATFPDGTKVYTFTEAGTYEFVLSGTTWLVLH